MLDRDEELKLLSLLTTLAGLLGVVVSVNRFQLGAASLYLEGDQLYRFR